MSEYGLEIGDIASRYFQNDEFNAGRLASDLQMFERKAYLAGATELAERLKKAGAVDQHDIDYELNQMRRQGE